VPPWHTDTPHPHPGLFLTQRPSPATRYHCPLPLQIRRGRLARRGPAKVLGSLEAGSDRGLTNIGRGRADEDTWGSGFCSRPAMPQAGTLRASVAPGPRRCVLGLSGPAPRRASAEQRPRSGPGWGSAPPVAPGQPALT
jgi:hypothetical protein